MISQEEVIKVAKLARIGVTDTEVKKLQEDLLSILNYFEKLKEVDASKISLSLHSSLALHVVREDMGVERALVDSDKLIQGVPQKHQRYIKVKSILQQ